jgi:hypothetical protein
MNRSPLRPFLPLFFRFRFMMRWLIGFTLTAAGVYGAVFVETGSRARSSYLEAEHFRHWFQDPAGMGRDLEAAYVKAIERLTVQEGKREISAEGLRLEQDILEARFRMRRAESPAKRAYFSYRDVYRLSSPVETDLSRRARLLAPAAKQAWREDAGRRGLPVTDVMFDPEPGETADRRVVYSTRDRFEATNLAAILQTKGVSVDVFDDARVPDAVRQGFWVTVAPSDFWRAHTELKSFLAPDLPAVFRRS